MIEPKLQAELRTRFNPDESPLRRYQLHLLEMLKDFDTICATLGVRYWLSSGTVLGAVRHGGFIPWDDDIDVEMLRTDYEKLVASFKETERYVIQTDNNDPYYPWLFAKFRDKKSSVEEIGQLDRNYKYRGSCIDIFIMEETHVLTSGMIWQGSRVMFHLSKQAHKSQLIRGVYTFVHICTKSLEWIIRHTTHHLPGKKFRFGYGNVFYRASRLPETIFPIGKIEFEGCMFPAPKDCRAYLSHVYGDYEKIPDTGTIHPHFTIFTSSATK